MTADRANDTTAGKPPRPIADALKAATAAMRRPDVIDVRQIAEDRPAKIVGPTPEQMRHADYVEDEVYDRSDDGKRHRVGRAYQRVPLFETMAKRGDRIDKAGLDALRFYRAAHEAAAASPTRCALNQEGRGAGLPLCIPFSIAGMHLEDLHGGTILDALERGVSPHLLATLRAVALDDRSFSAVAIERFGGRKVLWIDQEKSRQIDRKGNRARYVDKVAPKSGAHREVIAQEFTDAVAQLATAHAPYAGVGGVIAALAADTPIRKTPPPSQMTEAEAELRAMVLGAHTPVPAVDPDFLNADGHMRPMAEIAAIVRIKAGVSAAPDEGA